MTDGLRTEAVFDEPSGHDSGFEVRTDSLPLRQ
jgi:hypothetical protein